MHSAEFTNSQDQPWDRLLDPTAYYRYPSLDSLNKDMAAGDLISGVMFDDKHLFCFLQKSENGMMVVPLAFDDNEGAGEYVLPMQIYFSPVVAMKVVGLDSYGIPEKVDYFVLLGQFDKQGNPQMHGTSGPRYHCITSTWRERHPGNRFDYQCSL